MTPAERTELARLVKALDTPGHTLSVRGLSSVVRPLGLAAVTLVLSMDPIASHGCEVCGMSAGRKHRCSCPFSSLRRWAAQQVRQAA